MKSVVANVIFIILALQTVDAKIYFKNTFVLITSEMDEKGQICYVPIAKFLEAAMLDDDRSFPISWNQIDPTGKTTQINIDSSPITTSSFADFGEYTGDFDVSGDHYVGKIDKPTKEENKYDIKCQKFVKRNGHLRSVL